MTLSNKLALGTVQFGFDYGIANTSGQVGIEEAAQILDQASLHGIDTLDTAIGYGTSETVLGQLGVEHWRIITKLPAIPAGCKNITEWVFSQVKESTSRLQVRQLYGLLLHQPEQLLEDFGGSLYMALREVKNEGYAHKIGISVYELSELSELMNLYSFDLVQAPLNILDRSLIETGWAKMLHKSGVEIHTRSVFLQGLLLMSPKSRPQKFDSWFEIWSEWYQWLEKHELSPLQACIRYVCNQHLVDRVVIGVDSLCQLEQVIETSSSPLESLPKFSSLKDTRLINPSRWIQL